MLHSEKYFDQRGLFTVIAIKFISVLRPQNIPRARRSQHEKISIKYRKIVGKMFSCSAGLIDAGISRKAVRSAIQRAHRI